MSRRCPLTDKTIQVGHRVSHSNVKTNHRFLPNLQKKRFWSAAQNKFVSMRVSTHAIRSIDKMGFDTFLRKLGLK